MLDLAQQVLVILITFLLLFMPILTLLLSYVSDAVLSHVHHIHHTVFQQAMLCAVLSLVTADTGAGEDIDMGWLDALPAENDATLTDTIPYTMPLAKTMLAEVFELSGRYREAVSGLKSPT